MSLSHDHSLPPSVSSPEPSSPTSSPAKVPGRSIQPSGSVANLSEGDPVANYTPRRSRPPSTERRRVTSRPSRAGSAIPPLPLIPRTKSFHSNLSVNPDSPLATPPMSDSQVNSDMEGEGKTTADLLAAQLETVSFMISKLIRERDADMKDLEEELQSSRSSVQNLTLQVQELKTRLQRVTAERDHAQVENEKLETRRRATVDKLRQEKARQRAQGRKLLEEADNELRDLETGIDPDDDVLQTSAADLIVPTFNRISQSETDSILLPDDKASSTYTYLKSDALGGNITGNHSGLPDDQNAPFSRAITSSPTEFVQGSTHQSQKGKGTLRHKSTGVFSVTIQENPESQHSVPRHVCVEQ
ncbi:hypothetical protein SISNIDRAFT_489474 [Sistotremastrum niveocremeum HHB9708]|uniref:Uncharacterized protein n=1 Tax=Sistotremastrum niveocremeum HHB9708 TaxID=1314777 RepID=A0A164Q2H2_9AGAM|nr:hypothetical protein SISNIDRAFT_489474 [Sistotremastrum niveocremeum HHB9708]